MASGTSNDEAGLQNEHTRKVHRQPPQDLLNGSLIGALPQLLLRPVEFLHEATRQREGPFKITLAGQEAYVISSPELLQQVLQERNQHYVKGRVWDALRKLLGNGVGVSEGSFWLRQRRMLQPQFHPGRQSAFAGALVASLTESLSAWEPFVQRAAPFNIADEMGTIALAACTKALLGSDLSPSDALAVCRAAHTALDTMFLPMLTYWAPRWLPIPGAKRFAAAIHTVDAVVYRLIEQRRSSPRSGNDLLTLMLDARDPETGQTMNDQQLRDEVVTLFLAAYEPVVTALSWTWVLLDQHPAVEQQLRAESERVLGGNVPSAEDIPQLRYAKSVIQEVLRLYPPVWMIMREAARDEELGGVRIPAGSTVLGFIYGTHRSPQLFSDPDAFVPERFATDGAVALKRCAYLPFGTGPHKCLGEHFALLEAQLFLAAIMQRYRIRIVPGQRIKPRATFTLRPAHGVMATLQRA